MNESRNRLIMVVVALLMLAALGVWLWRDEPTVVAGTAPNLPAPAPASPADSVALPVSAPPPERTEAPVAAPTAPTVDPLLAHVRGRCVDETGAALAGCTATIHASGRNQDSMALQGKVEWKDPEPIVTREDGRFDFGFAPPSGMQFSFDVATDDRVPRTGRWSGFQPAQVVDLGDIRLARGFAVHGRVVDEQGVPVGKVSIRLANLPLPLAPDMGANDMRYGTSDANGEFLIRVPIPAGTWPLEVESRGLRLVTPDHVAVGERGAEPVLVTVRRMPSIEGIVVDEQGLPLEGIGVRAELNRSGRMASGRSRADGTFTIHAVDAEPKPVKLRVDDPGPCEPPAADERIWEWGSKDVRIELRRALLCELTVVERATGAPVTRFAVICYGDSSRSSRQRGMRLSGDHADGRVTVDRIWRGKNFLQVIPLDQALLPSATVEFEASDAGVPPLRIEVDRLASATVRVTRVDGTPIVGSKVEVIVKGTFPFNATVVAQDARSGSRSFSTDPRYRPHELITSVVTDGNGKAAVVLPPSTKDLVVRATGPHAPAIVDPATLVPGQEFVVVAPDGGSLVGKVALQGLEAQRVSVGLRRQAGEQESRSETTAILQADGSFALRDLTPGNYELRLTYAVPFRTGGFGSNGSMPLDVQAPPITIEPGRTTEVNLDATAIVPATVQGRVLLDGAVPSPARVFLRAERGATFGHFALAPAGTFEASGLLPGTYRLGLVLGDFQAAEGSAVLHDETFVLAAGQQLVSDFVFLRRRLVVTLMQSDGKTPAAGVLCFCTGESVPERRTTDKNGKFVFDPAPASALWIQPGSEPTRLGPVQVPAGQSVHEVTLTLPATTGGK